MSAGCPTFESWVLLHCVEHGLGEGIADQRERLSAAEIVVAGIRGAAFPQGDLHRRDEFGLERFHIRLLLTLGHHAIVRRGLRRSQT